MIYQERSKRRTARRGHALIYSTLCLTTLLGIGSLAVDASRVRTAKAELQSTTDAAARYAANAMRSTMANTSAAGANAAAVFAESRVDGTAPAFDAATDMTLGTWDAATRTFVPATIAAGANAVRIKSHLALGDDARPLALASMLGKSVNVRAEAIALMDERTATTYVSGKGNPWLSAMPNGTLSTNFRTNPAEQDYAGSGPNVASSPASIRLSTFNIVAGATITFDGVTGGTNYGPMAVNPNADGDASKIVTLGSPSFNDYSYFNSPTNGMSNVKAPICSMMAVFLDDAAPNATSAPTPLDFSTPASRDFTTLAAALKQVFFVGDARRANGEAQQFVVPPGATRLFIANMDGWQYNDNTGGYDVTIHSTVTISTVK